ncbi:hypothetical protein Nepgr_012080 [Nepenthes gracilis]|uniref:Uncharacterized protein n=1 Tax=Nepenthes gracilis TaxID=150966 RepID=A0AAD3SGC3_NEPGR|nr:hypothetical protein Nepgr_012080 [Nepenthes gracilis]
MARKLITFWFSMICHVMSCLCSHLEKENPKEHARELPPTFCLPSLHSLFPLCAKTLAGFVRDSVFWANLIDAFHKLRIPFREDALPFLIWYICALFGCMHFVLRWSCSVRVVRFLGVGFEMERASGQTSVPPASSFDKSRILDVKPLRTLVPMFPNPPQAPPFVCSSPFGPFPSGFSPFYPFSAAQGAQTSTEPQEQQDGEPPFRASNQDGGFVTPAAAVPLRSFGTPQIRAGQHFSGESNGDIGSSFGISDDGFTVHSSKRPAHLLSSKSSQNKAKKSRALSSADAAKRSMQNSALSLNPAQKDDGDRESVNYVLMKFDAVRRRLSQLEDAKESPSGLIRRADLKSGNLMMTTGIRTNARKRIGVVPGIEIGDIFFFRMEMCIVGLHSPSMAGIDYMAVSGEMGEEPLAVSIVSSGGYDDDAEDKDVLIYTGQGGNLGGGSRRDKAVSDQKLERGNLALDRSSRRANEIRVIRGIKDIVNPLSKVYVYDGLYSIQEAWVEKSKSGANSFKYKLVRIAGQPSAFVVWQSVQRWKAGNSSRAGLILPDLTSGAESIPVSLVNDIDDEKGPSYFTYFRTVRYSKSFNLTQPSFGCSCSKECSAGDLNCSCIRQNGGDFPYTSNGILVGRKPVVYECGQTCPCFPNCKNRVSQTGLKVRLEVFKTKDRGWGLRSWDPIRCGTFICEYAGEVMDKAKFDGDEGENNAYVFDTSRAFDSSFKWNYDPELIDEETTGDSNEEYDIPVPLVISSKDIGNIARFMNHSCSPNVFWQPILYEDNTESYIHIAFFAMRHISPMTELTYDYGTVSVDRNDVANVVLQKDSKESICVGVVFIFQNHLGRIPDFLLNAEQMWVRVRVIQGTCIGVHPTSVALCHCPCLFSTALMLD